MAAAARQRYDGAASGLAEVLLPFVLSPAWLKYGVAPKDPIKSTVLVAHGEMIRAVTKLCPNLAFKKQTILDALGHVAKVKAFKELEQQDELNDWLETMLARLRLVYRHISHSRCKKPPPAWLQLIDGPALVNAVAPVAAAADADAGDAVHDAQLPESEPASAEALSSNIACSRKHMDIQISMSMIAGAHADSICNI
jgi:hypothetical protein